MGRLATAFFCSGFGALLCQVVWHRMLGIFAGSDTVSAALVVGAFLMGLGVGSLAGAKLADRLPPARALLGFALCEAGIAVFALLSKPFLYDLLAVELAGVVDAPTAVFALCFAGLALPTTLMGASLPLLARAVATSLDTVAERVGWLYGLNTLGAGTGALAGGWLLVGNLGFVGTLLVAAALDLGAVLIALSLLPSLRGRPAPVPSRIGAATGPAAGRAPFGGLPLWCGLVFLSGYVIVALEILWVRLMGQVGQFHAYLFPTVLGVFLLADGAGIAVASRLVRRLRDPRPAFFLAQAGGFALAAALILALWLALPHWPLRNYLLVDQWRLVGRSFLATIVLTAVVVGPPSFLIGMTFPLVQRAVQQDLATVGARVGWVQLANIAGNAAGSVGTGLVSLHLLGTTGTLRLLAALSLALLLGWLWRAGGGPLRRRAPETALATACAAALVAAPSNAAFWNRMHGREPGAFAAWAEDRSGVAFFRGDTAGPGGFGGPFFIMGYAQGHIPFHPQHLLLGAAGPLLHPAPRRILAIGVGSGGTPWGALVSPDVKELRAVEIIGPVLTALGEVAQRGPDGPAAALLADARARFEYGDGRRMVAGTAERYDVIEADAIRPETSHSGLLHSKEFLEQVRRRLAPGGLHVQWAPTWRVVETFAAAFPHAVMLRPANIMVGSDSPIPADAAERLLARLSEPAPAAHLARGGPATAEMAALLDPGRTVVWQPEDPRGPAPLTDMFPRDELFVNNGIDETWDSERPPARHAATAAGR